MVQIPPSHQHHHHDQQRASCNGGVVGSSSFSPRKWKTPPPTAIAVGSATSGSSDHRRRNPAEIHTAAGSRSAAGTSVEWRWWAPSRAGSSWVMRGAGEGGAEAEGRARREPQVEGVESALRLFNTEGRTKQPFRPQDKRQARASAKDCVMCKHL